MTIGPTRPVMVGRDGQLAVLEHAFGLTAAKGTAACHLDIDIGAAAEPQ